MVVDEHGDRHTHIAQATLTTQIEFDQQTLNKKSNGNWVNVKIGLPRGYMAIDVDISSTRLEGRVPAELRPTSIQSKVDGDTLMIKWVGRAEVLYQAAVELPCPTRNVRIY